jgi:hypothetical protein
LGAQDQDIRRTDSIGRRIERDLNSLQLPKRFQKGDAQLGSPDLSNMLQNLVPHEVSIYPCTMEIKDHLRLVEAWRKQVPRLAIIEAAASIRHQLSLVIVDRKHDPMPEESATGINFRTRADLKQEPASRRLEVRTDKPGR